ncbi:MAG TPA: toll/interleukin-1 receptor domain-containing protein [Kofleriaceae bacterium]|nr:toll/interleukin-1 receptor domain-containing protein [Kofleriaceae bacterium]
MTLSISEPHAMQASASSLAHEVFVVHTDAPGDLAFVDGYLLANLGLAPERVFRLQDLELGQPIPEEIERGVRSSRVTIVVLSAAYMDDRWVAFGQQLAAYASLADDAHGVLLPLLLEDCELTMHVASLVKLDFRNSAREAWDREMVLGRTYDCIETRAIGFSAGQRDAPRVPSALGSSPRRRSDHDDWGG